MDYKELFEKVLRKKIKVETIEKPFVIESLEELD